MRIHALSPLLANQIAAGEVIERPASVLKELLENSLDAGATQIDVEVQKGGSQLIRVRDNGHGIYKEDLELALDRHATSKIATLDDLEHINTLGFRGEALASISSVSRFSLTSRVKEAEVGWQISTEGCEKIINLRPCAHPVGTTIEVCELFFNTPARRHFLKTEKTEFIYLEELLKRISLSHFNVGFTLKHAQKTVIDLQPAHDSFEQEERLAKLCGINFIEHAKRIEAELEGVRLHGWITDLEFHRSQADLQYFYVNERVIRDRLINHALRQSYQEFIYPGRHPAFVLFLEVNPEIVDVNVHPTKHEVRFRQARAIHSFLTHTLTKAWACSDHASNRTVNLEQDSQRSVMPFISPAAEVRKDAISVAPVNFSTKPISHPTKVAEPVANYLFQSPQNKERLDEKIIKQEPKSINILSASHEKIANFSYGTVLTMLSDRYIITENLQGITIFDRYLMRQSIVKYYLYLAYQTDDIRIQNLLVPTTLHVSKNLTKNWEREQSSYLQKLGFHIAMLGPESLVVRQVPAMISVENINTMVMKLIEILAEPSENEESRVNNLIDCVARHEKAPIDASSKLTRKLTLLEMNSLLREFFSIQTPPKLVKNKHVYRQYSWDELPGLLLS